MRTYATKPAAAESATAGPFRFPAPPVQCKLRLSRASDPLEQEADRVAERIAGTDLSTVRVNLGGSAQRTTVARACAECEKEKDKHTKREREDDELHGKLTQAPKGITPQVEDKIRSLSGGEPLPSSERAFFEPRFQHDFSGVRIHSGPEAASTATAIGARAFAFGNHVAFALGEYAPATLQGRQLLAHELTHVVQQGGAQPGTVQRDLATPEPATAPAAQPGLTKDQIKTALSFNKSHFNATSTKEIQDLVGTEPTGKWIEDDIIAIASIQESYGLKKDGRVGPNTFRFLDKEVTAEGLQKTDDNCLVSFNVDADPATVGAVAGGQRFITGHFRTSSMFPKHCGCGDYEYRQFIRGHWRRTRGGAVTDLGPTFTTIPGGGGLPAAFIEDGNTGAAALNYGHRNQTAEVINHYLDDAGKVDQAKGCNYASEDTPGGPDAVVTGDVFDIDVNFRGEIRRKAKVVATRFWSAIRGTFPVP